VKLEQSILSSIHNPFLVKLYYSFHTRKNLYLVLTPLSRLRRRVRYSITTNLTLSDVSWQVMEFIRGGDLFSLLENMGALSEDVAKGMHQRRSRPFLSLTVC
jgi:serine/threonine protein kinase